MTGPARPRRGSSLFHRVILIVTVMIALGLLLASLLDSGPGLVAGFLLLALLAYFLIRFVFRPLFQLEQTVVMAEHGQYASDEGVPTELGRLSMAVDAVVHRLARNRQYLSSRVLRALEEERKRIARELHDETSQSLTTLVLNIDMALSALDAEGQHEKVRAILGRTRGLTLLTLEEIRKLIFDLRPTILDDLGLVPAVRWYAMNKMEPVGVEMSFEVQGLERRLAPDLETAMFRIVQEALTNVMKHAGADRVEITIKANEEVVIAQVRDNGRGFDPRRVTHEIGADRRGVGLFGMEERVKLLGGSFEIESSPGRGTAVRVSIPRSAARHDSIGAS